MPKRLLFRTKWALIFIAIILCCGWLYLYSDSVHQRRKAERLLSELRVFSFTSADFGQVRDFAIRHGGGAIGSNLERPPSTCTPRDCEFELAILPLQTKWLRDQERFFALLNRAENYIGLRPWGLTVRFTVSNGTLQHSRIEVGQARISSSRDCREPILIEYTVDIDRTSTPYSTANHENDYVVMRPHVTGPPMDVLHAWALQNASRRSVRAFDIDLRCLTTVMRGCLEFGELAPSAWEDYEAAQRHAAPAPCRSPRLSPSPGTML